MIETFVGLARYNENGEQTGGVPGDQLQVNKPDPNGELALIPLADFLALSTGCTIYRTVKPEFSSPIGDGIVKACNNPYIGYDVNNRLSVITYGVYSGKNGKNVECDNSSLSRVVIRYGTGIDLGDYTNNNVRAVLDWSDMFMDGIELTDTTKLYVGDILILAGSNLIGIIGFGEGRPIPNPNAGTTDYNDLENKPSINGTTVEGDKTSTDYHIGGGGNTPGVDGEKLVFY